MPFIGKQSSANSQITNYTTTVGSGGQTNFTVVIDGGDETHVYLNGVLLKETTDYTVSSTQVSLVSAAVENDIVEIKVYRSFALADAVKATGGTFTGTVAHTGTLDVSGGTLTTSTAQKTTIVDGGKGNLAKGDVGLGNVTNDAQVPASGGTFSGNVSFGDNNITNVGDIAVDTISSDAGTSIGVTLGTDVGDDFNVGSGKLVVEGDTGQVGIGVVDPSELFHVKNSSGNARVKIESDQASSEAVLKLDVNATSSFASVLFQEADTDKAGIIYRTTEEDLNFRTGGSGISNTRVNIASGGDVTVNTGNLVIGTAGKGIDFSNASGTTEGITGEVLEHVETGTWSPSYGSATTNMPTTFTSISGSYTKIGNLVYLNWVGVASNGSGNVTSGDYFRFNGAPFSSNSNGIRGFGTISTAQNVVVTSIISPHGTTNCWFTVADATITVARNNTTYYHLTAFYTAA